MRSIVQNGRVRYACYEIGETRGKCIIIYIIISVILLVRTFYIYITFVIQYTVTLWWCDRGGCFGFLEIGFFYSDEEITKLIFDAFFFFFFNLWQGVTREEEASVRKNHSCGCTDAPLFIYLNRGFNPILNISKLTFEQ